MEEVLDSEQSPDCEEVNAMDARAEARKRKCEPRQLVDSIHLSVLLSSYHHFFAKFSETLKKASKQIIPKTVWDQMYEKYVEQFPDLSFNPETLKTRVRETLEEIGTGRSDCRMEGGNSPQLDEFLQKIKETNGHASRNILNLRSKLMIGKTTPTAKASAKSANTQQDDSRADVPTQSTNRTKKELLEDQTGSLSTMAGELTTSNQIMSDWIDEKRKTTVLYGRDH